MFRRYVLLAFAVLLSACATSAPTPTRPQTMPETVTPSTVAFALEPHAVRGHPRLGQRRSGARTHRVQALLRGARFARSRSAACEHGAYGGTVADWRPACDAATMSRRERSALSSKRIFSPVLVRGEGEARLTAYYEPIIDVRRYPEPGFTEPLRRRPTDMVTVELAEFAEAYDNEVLRGAPRRLTGHLSGQHHSPISKARSHPRRSEPGLCIRASGGCL
ncbi:MAG: MltA domain-containing protein [Terricaulis sp.]